MASDAAGSLPARMASRIERWWEIVRLSAVGVPRFARRTSSRATPTASSSTTYSSLWVALPMARWNRHHAARPGGCRKSRLRLVRRPHQQFEVVIRPARGGGRGHLHFEAGSNLMHLGVVDRAPVQKERERLRHGCAVDRRDAEAAAGSHLDQALRSEHLDGLADDGARDAELLPEFALRGQARARCEAPGDDRLKHVVGDLVGQARVPRHLVEGRGIERQHRAYSMPYRLREVRENGEEAVFKPSRASPRTS